MIKKKKKIKECDGAPAGDAGCPANVPGADALGDIGTTSHDVAHVPMMLGASAASQRKKNTKDTPFDKFVQGKLMGKKSKKK
jgi:hypothetical protein